MKKLLIPALLAASFSAHAASVLDFTNNATGFTGSFAGTTYALTSNPAGINTDQAFDGGTCPVGLACDNDGVGIVNDEVGVTNVGTSEQGPMESLTLTFDDSVQISAFSFLDIFDTEYATVQFNGTGPSFDVHSSGAAGGYVEYSLADAIWTNSMTFSAPIMLGDDGDNEFALASVSAVPVPAAAFLFAPALLGFMGLRRKAQKAA